MARPVGFHRRDTLLALLWPKLDHAHARNALRQAVHSLREALGQDVVEGRGEEELGIAGERLWCDVRGLETALERGELEQALELYRGELLSGLHVAGVPEFERWMDGEREHVRRRAGEAAQRLTDREEAAGNPAGAARWARRLSELSPSDETAVQRLIQLLNRAGDRAGAALAYHEFERGLVRDLELEPSSALGGLTVESHQEMAPAVRPGRLANKRIAAMVALALSGVLSGGWLVLRDEPGARTADTARSAKRLVVLPFANLGPSEDAHFTAGVTEELTARLAVVDRLRVIGSTSANSYRNTTKALAEIGRELGVDYVLEGSVRWQRSANGPPRVRVTPQLVSTVDGTHLWAQVYDEPLDEIFRVQSDIAKKVVQALDLTLLEPQRRAVTAVPTVSLEAYQYYLRGNEFQLRRGTEERPTRAAVQMYEKALELDSGFALAHAMLSRAHSRMYSMYIDHSENRRALAKRAVDRAIELEPDLPEAHHALGAYYMGGLDWDRALREFAIAEISKPNESNIYMAQANIRMRQGKFREAIVEFEKARQLDPASSNVASNYGHPYGLLRDFPRAEAMYDRAIALAPDRPYPYFAKSWLYLRWDGSTRRARPVLEQARAAGVADQPFILYTRASVEILDRKAAEAIKQLSSAPEILLSDQFRFVPRAQLLAQAYGLVHRRGLERAHYDSARSLVSMKLQDQPDDARLHSALGIAYAGLNRKQEAVQEGRIAVELLPISKEAQPGYDRERDLARIYTMVGQYDAAVDRLEYLLSISGDLTSAWLRIDPVWDPLRSHPRFRRLVDRSI
jgi:serine/threonine-protein kinase